MATIHSEARAGTLTSAKLAGYLQQGVDINEIDVSGTGFTPLSAAAKAGHQTVVELLLNNGASPSKKSYGMTPLYIAANARKNRAEIVRLILNRHVNVDETDPQCDNETPLMVAITRAKDPVVVNMLIDAGASLQAQNDKGQTAKSMAQMSGNPDIQRAASPGQQQAGTAELINLLVNFVLFILAYVNSGILKDVAKGVVSNLYQIGNTAPDQDLARQIGEPTTADDFKREIDQYVKDSDLGQFFAPGNDYLNKVAEKAIELKDDPRNHLKKPEQIKGLVRLALYQPVFYCDDSGSMEADIQDGSGNVIGTRMDGMRSLVQRMASIATRLVPDGKGAHVRFINSSTTGQDLNADQINQLLQFNPNGGTNIGTNLTNKILEPMIYADLDKSGGALERPFLVLTITDGEPNPEPQDTFKKAIENCGRRLEEKQYPQECESSFTTARAIREKSDNDDVAAMFLISQVGNSPEADAFLDSLSGDPAIDRVLYRTSGMLLGVSSCQKTRRSSSQRLTFSTERLNERFADLRDNEEGLEEWLFNILMQPITG
ncbi:unnamed protein product [Clonostachys solani]|uniref:Ankyrin repeat protein n=1 Tax=Clonostachys solani TaxID=160281 RepID=A0A9N9W8W8_9HYPO|nr:unnamed protein product [Clonostachys solani]